ncbi:MAG: methyltransferase [Desulfovibrionaceae bacterium]|nr:methyltransferase [Desulfovibrionaceae bacterium]
MNPLSPRLPTPPPSPAAHEARNLFPRGLIQPDKGFHFSRDALLLIDFAAGLNLPSGAIALDLGAGCGVIGLGLLLRRPDLAFAVGLERDPAQVEAARGNALRLDLRGRYAALAGDLADKAALRAARAALPAAPDTGAPFHLVLCNPPWRREGAGRTPPSPARRAALFGDESSFPLFLGAADRLLAFHGALALVCGAERLTDILAALPPRLRPVRLRFVHPRAGKPAVFVLLEARKGSRAALRVEAPLLLDGHRVPAARNLSPPLRPDERTAGHPD